jgi:hypothetical protein
MSQRFTVELEWRSVYRATIDVRAEDLADASFQALDKAGTDRDVWGVAVTGTEAPFVLRITAHAAEKSE